MKRVLVLMLILAVLLGKARPAAAHGGGVVRVQAARLGPYRVTVWTAPEPPRVGAFHVTVAVYRPGTRVDTPVRGARVAVVLKHESGSHLRVSAEQGDIYPYHYEADVNLDQPGSWQVEVWVRVPDVPEPGVFPFTVQVEEPGRWHPVMVAGAVLVGMALAWWFWSRRGGAPDATRRTS